jgi:hypothetical protein
LFLLEVDPVGVGAFWIGLTDLAHEGNWIWLSSGKLAEFTNWKGTEPTNRNGKEHFGHLLNLHSEYGRKWNDCPNEAGHPDSPSVCDLPFHGICQNSIK